MKSLAPGLLTMFLGLLILPQSALGHFGAEAFILVPADTVDPGEPFEVIVADLTPGSSVVLEVVRDGQRVEVGRTSSDTEGHFTTNATLPAEYAPGYTELVATAQDGTLVATWILVGPPTSGSGPPPGPGQPGGGVDPSLVVLGLMLAGAASAAGYLVLRRQTSMTSVTGAPRSSERHDRRVARKRR